MTQAVNYAVFVAPSDDGSGIIFPVLDFKTVKLQVLPYVLENTVPVPVPVELSNPSGNGKKIVEISPTMATEHASSCK